MDNRQPIVLIDAYSQIYRSFHALPSLTTARGEATNALLSVARFFLSLDELYPDRPGAVVFDSGPPKRRLSVSPEYKANRPPMPDELQEQIPLIRDWLQKAGWPILEKEGFEADDMVAAVISQYRDSPADMISSDKDLAQLVDERVTQLIPGKKNQFTRWGPEEVEQKFGVPPSLIPDYLALVGDSSDNIAGVPGVGPKTAAKLLREFGDFDALLENISAISQKNVRQKLADNAELVKRNRELVDLNIDSGESLPEQGFLERQRPDWESLIEFAHYYELGSVLKTLKSKKEGEEPTLF